MPISINGAYAGMGRRFKSKAYKLWEKISKAYYEDNYNEFDIIEGELLVRYTFHSNFYNKNGTIKKKDAENYVKVLSDQLGHLIPWFDDSAVWKLNIEKVQSDEEFVEITITKYKFS